MTSIEFFGGIEKNLLRLTSGRTTRKCKSIKKLTEKDPSAPVDLRVYDLVGGRGRFRVFAAFVGEATVEAYREMKFRIRKWYQESGWSDAAEKPYSGAMVIGAANAWPEGMKPNADDMPFAEVEFQVLAAPSSEKGRGVETVTSGDASEGAWIFRALGEDFELRERRVVGYIEGLFALPEISRGGHVFVEDVAEKTGVGVDEAMEIVKGLQDRGVLTIRKSFRIYVEPGAAPLWMRISPFVTFAVMLGAIAVFVVLKVLF